MIDVGIVGLDTSHPVAFATILDERDGTAVTAAWDGGTVRDGGYAETFRDRHGVELYDDPHAMIGDVDAVLVLAVDWTIHRRLAVPFLEAGLPTMVDKPIAGSVTAVDAIEAAARAGDAPLFGGSAVPFHPSVAELRTTDPETVFAAGYDHPFYYGAHLVDAVRRLVDVAWTRVEPLDGTGTAVRIAFEDGATATLRFDGATTDAAFGFLTVGDATRTALVEGTADALDRMYEPFVDAFVAMARGERDDRDRLADAARLLVAAHAALEADTVIEPDAASLGRTTVGSDAFLSGYEPYY